MQDSDRIKVAKDLHPELVDLADGQVLASLEVDLTSLLSSIQVYAFRQGVELDKEDFINSAQEFLKTIDKGIKTGFLKLKE